MHDHTEEIGLMILSGVGLVGLFGMAYFPPASMDVMLPILSGIVGGAFSALYRALGVNGKSTPNGGLGPRLPGTE